MNFLEKISPSDINDFLQMNNYLEASSITLIKEEPMHYEVEVLKDKSLIKMNFYDDCNDFFNNIVWCKYLASLLKDEYVFYLNNKWHKLVDDKISLINGEVICEGQLKFDEVESFKQLSFDETDDFKDNSYLRMRSNTKN